MFSGALIGPSSSAFDCSTRMKMDSSECENVLFNYNLKLPFLHLFIDLLYANIIIPLMLVSSIRLSILLFCLSTTILFVFLSPISDHPICIPVPYFRPSYLYSCSLFQIILFVFLSPISDHPICIPVPYFRPSYLYSCPLFQTILFVFLSPISDQI